MGHNPNERVVVISYSELLSRNHANDFRRLVNDPFFQTVFPGMRLTRDTDREIMTTKRGKRIATSIDGTLTGLRKEKALFIGPRARDSFQRAAAAGVPIALGSDAGGRHKIRRLFE